MGDTTTPMMHPLVLVVLAVVSVLVVQLQPSQAAFAAAASSAGGAAAGPDGGGGGATGILVLQGGFKPPHKGHFGMVQRFFKECVRSWEDMDQVYVFSFMTKGSRGGGKMEFEANNFLSAVVWKNLYLPILQEDSGGKIKDFFFFETNEYVAPDGMGPTYSLLQLAAAVNLNLGITGKIVTGRTMGEYVKDAEVENESGNRYCSADVQWPDARLPVITVEQREEGGVSATKFRKLLYKGASKTFAADLATFLPPDVNLTLAVQIFSNAARVSKRSGAASFGASVWDVDVVMEEYTRLIRLSTKKRKPEEEPLIGDSAKSLRQDAVKTTDPALLPDGGRRVAARGGELASQGLQTVIADSKPRRVYSKPRRSQVQNKP